MLGILAAVVALLGGSACTPKEMQPVTAVLGLANHSNEYVSLASAEAWVAAV
jgi:hypothetical protein